MQLISGNSKIPLQEPQESITNPNTPTTTHVTVITNDKQQMVTTTKIFLSNLCSTIPRFILLQAFERWTEDL